MQGRSPADTSKPYRPGEFDFLAAYIIAEDVWYIIPAKTRDPREQERDSSLSLRPDQQVRTVQRGLGSAALNNGAKPNP